MKKILITGFSGFVSNHFLDYLEANQIQTDILGIDVSPFPYPDKKYQCVRWQFIELDLLDKDRTQYQIHKFQPDYILHLASYSSVAFSWQNPVISFQNNINIFLNLLEAIRSSKLKCRILSIGSSEEYGNINQEKIPLKEDYIVDPVSPYAVARVSQELLSKVYVNGYGLDIVMTRSFNHIGPGQRENFVISSFTKQLVEMKLGIRNEKVLVTGDINIIRDFTDVRDVVHAYYLLLEKGKKGEIYNVCSGKGNPLKSIIDTISDNLKLSVEIKTNPDLIRPNDNKRIIGSDEKICNKIGWQRKYSLEQTLKDMIIYWEAKLSH